MPIVKPHPDLVAGEKTYELEGKDDPGTPDNEIVIMSIEDHVTTKMRKMNLLQLTSEILMYENKIADLKVLVKQLELETGLDSGVDVDKIVPTR